MGLVMMGLDPGPLVRVIFSFYSGKSVGSVEKSICHVCGIGSGIIVLTGIKSIGDVVLLVVFVPKGVVSKYRVQSKMFPTISFSSMYQKSFYLS